MFKLLGIIWIDFETSYIVSYQEFQKQWCKFYPQDTWAPSKQLPRQKHNWWGQKRTSAANRNASFVSCQRTPWSCTFTPLLQAHSDQPHCGHLEHKPSQKPMDHERSRMKISGVYGIKKPKYPVARIRQMSGQVSRGSTGEYQADERAGVARLSWR